MDSFSTSQEPRELFSTAFEEYASTLPQRAVLVEDLVELGNILPFKSTVKQEFYMPKHLNKVDPNL